MKTKLTIFTPTYNREHLLPRLYASLCNQTSLDFEWLIADDGSTDNTAELVKKWQAEKKIDIRYVYRENGGMLKAHETAYENMDSGICTCIDSDDWMPVDAIENIHKAWEKYGASDSDCCGLIGLDAYGDGKTVGVEFPESPWKCRYIDFLQAKVVGDKKFVHRVDIIKQYLPYPHFEGEKFPVTSYLYYFMGEKYHYYAMNDVYSFVEYQEDGLSKNIINQYRKSPRSFAQCRIAGIKYSPSISKKFREAIHLNASMLLSGDFSFFSKSEYKPLVLLAFPVGLLLYFYIRFTSKSSLNPKLNKE